uniref:non-specific serine/threonine protein kinase n=1 Tax=Panagrellus redivivus TaxID=6233 RepID=A0A7E4UUD5_PANRE
MTSRGTAARPLSTERLSSRSKRKINEAAVLINNVSNDGIGNSAPKTKRDKRKTRRKHSNRPRSRTKSGEGTGDGVQKIESSKGAAVMPCVPKPKRSRKKTKRKIPSDVVPINSVIETEKNKYKVLKKLGSGGCGEAFVVENISTKKILAVKAEFQKNPEKRLRREFDIYRVINSKKKENRNAVKHLLPILDFGECPNVVQFLFLPLCAGSLEGLLKSGFPTLATAFEVGIQTLESIQDLHTLGYIHRDIKPANFVINEGKTMVYVIDFGMSCRFITDPSKMPESSVYDFIGTVRYAPRSAHKGLPQSRRDDIEAWLYVALELFVPDILPWSIGEIQNKDVTLMKEAFFEGHYARRLEQAPPCFYACIAVVKALSPFDEPRYDRIIDDIKHEARQRQIKLRQGLSFNSTAFAMVAEMAKTNALIEADGKSTKSPVSPATPEAQPSARNSNSEIVMQTISQKESNAQSQTSPAEAATPRAASQTSREHSTTTDKESDVVGDNSVEMLKSSARCKVLKATSKSKSNKNKDDDDDEEDDGGDSAAASSKNRKS